MAPPDAPRPRLGRRLTAPAAWPCLLCVAVALLGAGVFGAEARGADPAVATLGWNLNAIQVTDAHRVTRGQGAVVAVIDSGVDVRHPRLAAGILGGVDLVDGDRSGTDEHGHGTHVAGIIAARPQPGSSVLGVAPAAKILAVRVLDDQGQGNISQVARGVDAALAAGAQVINLSTQGAEAATDAPAFAELTQAVERAARAGVVVVAAAGNSSMPACAQPLVAARILCVGAIDRQRRRASYSNYASRVTIMGPGGSPDDGSAIVSTALGGGYCRMAGTSQATPHVAGVAALLISLGLRGPEVIDRIERTAIDLGEAGEDAVYGHGLVDAGAAVRGLGAAAPAPSAFARAPHSVRMVTLRRAGLAVSCRSELGGACTARVLSGGGRLLAWGTRELDAGATRTVRALLTTYGRRLLRRAALTTGMLRVSVYGAPVFDQRVAVVR